MNHNPLFQRAKSRAALQTTQNDHRFPIYLRTSEENLHSQEYFSLKAVKNPYGLSVGLPENRTHQQPAHSLREILEGISHYRHIPVNKTDYCTASPSKAREPGLLRLRMWFKPWEGIWKMLLLTAERREGRWRKLILNQERADYRSVNFIMLWQKKVRGTSVQSSSLLNPGLTLKCVPALSKPWLSFFCLLHTWKSGVSTGALLVLLIAHLFKVKIFSLHFRVPFPFHRQLLAGRWPPYTQLKLASLKRRTVP